MIVYDAIYVPGSEFQFFLVLDPGPVPDGFVSVCGLYVDGVDLSCAIKSQYVNKKNIDLVTAIFIDMIEQARQP